MPTLLEVMQSRLGVQETPGRKNNPVIVGWFETIGHPEVIDDETSWCSTCMASAALEAGLPPPPREINMMARAWLTWGLNVALNDIQPGDIAIWPRGNSAWQGHVNIVEKVLAAGGKVVCIGGNQGGLSGGDAVTRAKARNTKEALGFRRPVMPTVKDLRAAGSTDIALSDTVNKIGIAATGLAAVAKAAQDLTATPAPPPVAVTDALKLGADNIGFVQKITEGANAVVNLFVGNPWLVLVAVVATGCFGLSTLMQRHRVRRAQLGHPLSSQV